MSKVTMTRRFYVGSSRMSNGEAEQRGWMKTYKEALSAATDLVSNGTDEVRYVVEVVAIVRRKEQPVIVEEVRR